MHVIVVKRARGLVKTPLFSGNSIGSFVDSTFLVVLLIDATERLSVTWVCYL